MSNKPRVLNRTGRRVPDGAVYIGRPRDQYRRWLCGQPKLLAALPELRGRDLVCWCAPLPCHGDVLLELANGRADEEEPA
jgi:hypothetical protein